MAGTVSCAVCMRRSASVRTSSAQGGRGLPCRMFFPRRKRYACESMKETKCSAQLFMAQQMTKELKSSGGS